MCVCYPFVVLRPGKQRFVCAQVPFAFVFMVSLPAALFTYSLVDFTF